MNTRLKAARTTKDTKEFPAKLQALMEAADRLCEQSGTMPARMDAEACARSRLLVRAAGVISLAVAGIQVILAASGALAAGWWITAVITGGVGLALLTREIGAAGSGIHQGQRLPAMVAAAAVTVNLVFSLLPAPRWTALVLMIVAVAFCLFAGPGARGPETAGRRSGK